MSLHQQPYSPTRRAFLKLTAAAGAAAVASPLLRSQTPLPSNSPSSAMPQFHIFSKHLQFLDFPEMAEAAAAIGFDGVDLAVRPDGHVEPERVRQELPRAAAAIAAAGLRLDLITTAVDDANKPLDRDVLEAAAEAGGRYYRMNWYRYPETGSLSQALDSYQTKVQELSRLNQELSLVGCYQNHAGTMVGASLWEVWQLLQGADEASFGIQYDPRHATVEGGLSWPTGMRLALPRIKTLVVKDFKWVEKGGRNEIVNTPVGEGTVDFKRCFRALKDAGLDLPISLHLEYDIGGAQWGRRELTGSPERVYEAMGKDLAAAKQLWSEA